MKNMELTLIRHGETTWNQEGRVQGQADPPLSPIGKAQAQKLAKEMQPELDSYTCIYTSTMKRAFETARCLKGEHPISLVPEDRLRSRNLGVFSGMTIQEIKQQYPAEFAHWISGDLQFRPPDGQSTGELAGQIQSFIADLPKNHIEKERIIIVTHREDLGVLMHFLSGKPFDQEMLKIPNCTPLKYQFNFPNKLT